MVLSLSLGILIVAPEDPRPTEAAAINDGGNGSAVTVHGRREGFEDFTNLAITVSQTKNLTNQAIEVTWTGGTPTARDRVIGQNFLQIMQCWGDPDDPNDPDGLIFRETCEFGVGITAPALSGNGDGAYDANRRDVALNVLNRDPKEKPPPPRDNPATDVNESDIPGTLADDAKMVPFMTVQGIRSRNGSADKPYRLINDPNDPEPPYNQVPETDVDVVREYFSEASSNEIPYALTSGDGTGRAVFELQNAGRAPDLGCGAATVTRNGQTVPGPHCSLVIVPRGDHDPETGAKLDDFSALSGSPFRPSIWQHRIVVPLSFAPATGYCPLDKAERRTAGTEMVAEAITSWQPAVCAGNGPVIGYSAAGDAEAARQIAFGGEGAPGLVFTADPVTPGSGGPPVVNAPVALSGMELAINIDANIVDPNQADGPVPPEVRAIAGSALRDIKLTPRLVAKLLTQSYTAEAKDSAAVKGNPRSIRYDPEFLTLNPVFQYWDRTPSSTLNGLMVALGNSSGARQVWRWLLADPEAAAFMAGEPDESGMKINSHYKGIADASLDYFPKADPVCTDNMYQGIVYSHCSQTQAPYMNNFSEAALQTLRADTKGRTSTFKTPDEYPDLQLPEYTAIPRQPPGFRFAMSIVDSASAGRYSLFPAQLCRPLRDAKGTMIAPTDCRTPNTASLTAAVAAGAVPSTVGGTPTIDPVRAWKAAGAYPLAMLTYAVGNLSEPEDARKDYARLLRQAAGEGQQLGFEPGQLPPGYAPLPQAMRQQTMVAADTLERGAPASPQPTGDVPPAENPAATPPAGPPASVPAAAPPPAGSPQPSAERVSRATPGSPIGNLRFLLIVLLSVGLATGVIGPILRRVGAGSPTQGGPPSAKGSPPGGPRPESSPPGNSPPKGPPPAEGAQPPGAKS